MITTDHRPTAEVAARMEPRQALCALPVTPAAAGQLRGFARSSATVWGATPQVGDDLALIVTELVTNVILHSGSPDVILRLHTDGRTLRVEVCDTPDGGRLPRRPTPRRTRRVRTWTSRMSPPSPSAAADWPSSRPAPLAWRSTRPVTEPPRARSSLSSGDGHGPRRDARSSAAALTPSRSLGRQRLKPEGRLCGRPRPRGGIAAGGGGVGTCRAVRFPAASPRR